MKGRKRGGPSVKGKGILSFFLSYTGGERGSPVRTAGDRGLVSSLTQRDSSGQEKGKIGSEGGDFYGGGEERKGE